MSKLQRVYRLLRSEARNERAEARYAAPRIVAMTTAQLDVMRTFG